MAIGVISETRDYCTSESQSAWKMWLTDPAWVCPTESQTAYILTHWGVSYCPCLGVPYRIPACLSRCALPTRHEIIIVENVTDLGPLKWGLITVKSRRKEACCFNEVKFQKLFFREILFFSSEIIKIKENELNSLKQKKSKRIASFYTVKVLYCTDRFYN